MQSLTLLLFGENIPSHRHLRKLSNKFINIFLKEREKETFNEADYYEVIVEERYLGNQQRETIYCPVIPVHKDFLHQVEAIYSNLNAEMVMCTMQHEHPIAYIEDTMFEGYCYYAKETNEKILFFTNEEPYRKFYKRLPKEASAEKVITNWLKQL